MPSSLTRVLPFVLGFSPRPPASVCGTGTFGLVSTFSRQRGFTCFATYFHSPSRFSFAERVLHYAPAYALGRALPSTRSCYPSVSMLPQTSLGGTGISTCYPSPTTIVLGLGPDLPWADEPSPGNLGLSTAMFLAWLALLIPAFSLLHRPQVLSVLLQPMHNAPLPITPKGNPEASVTCFSPVYLRRTITRPVSYYALFE